MTYKHYTHRSQIIDFLEIPSLYLHDKRDEDLTNSERQLLADVLEDKEKLFQELKPLEAEMKKYFLSGQYYSLASEFYLLGLSRGRDPKTPLEALQSFKKLTQEELDLAFRKTLHSNHLSEEENKLPHLELLELNDFSADVSWHWYQALTKPQDFVAGLIDFLTKVVDIYQPYYDRYADERQAYLEQFDLEKLAEELSMPELPTEPNLFLLSPMHFVLALFDHIDYDIPVSLILSPRVEKFIQTRKSLDLESFIAHLKTISDESRYQVLKAIIEPHAKNKEIAQQLGITTAAVSFHTQKLINSQLVLFDSENSNQKFKVNKPLLKEMIEKLQEDFNL